MKKSRHSAPEVNAGSMADIAFLLLIFFLVSTTISADKGINRQLPRDCPPGTDCSTKIADRNILRISINGKDELLVNESVISIMELKQMTKDFVDNNGDKSCAYCSGSKQANASDNPNKAVISLQNDKQTSYEMYIAVQDILTKAYYELREDYATTILNKSVKDLTASDLKDIKKAYPFMISEAETKK